MFRPFFNSSSNVDGANQTSIYSPGAAAIEWNHSPTVSPQRGEGIVNLRPTYDTVEVPIHKTPDRPLRELKYSFHDKYLRGNQKGNIIFDGLGFRYSKGPKSLTCRCTSWSKKLACLAKVIVSLV